MSQELQPGEEGMIARKLLRSLDCGVLATMSQELPGFPFGSVTPYVTTHDGHVVILVSDIAQHTKNMGENDKVCLTVMDNADGNKQEQGRATIIGHARPVPSDRLDEASERYFAFFPEARHYSKAHAFTFFWIETVRVRYIGGFGKIFWIEEEDWGVPAPEWSTEEAEIVKHMNDDHSSAVVAMTKVHAQVDDPEATLIAMDPEGCHLKTKCGIHYLSFGTSAMTKDSVREAMIALTKTPSN